MKISLLLFLSLCASVGVSRDLEALEPELKNPSFSDAGSSSEEPVPGWKLNNLAKEQKIEILPHPEDPEQKMLAMRYLTPVRSSPMVLQRMKIEPGESYIVSARYRREGPGHFSYLQARLLKNGRYSSGNNENRFRLAGNFSGEWILAELPFDAGDANGVEIRIQHGYQGQVGRELVGSTLFVDSVSLIQRGDLEKNNLVLRPDKEGIRKTVNTLGIRYFPWFRGNFAAGEQIRFTVGEETWVFPVHEEREGWFRPAVFDLEMPDGKASIEVVPTKSIIEEVILTPDAFWQPEDYDFHGRADDPMAKPEVTSIPDSLTLSVVGEAVSGSAVPVSGGIPLPQGLVRDLSQIYSPDRRIQVSEMRRWPDGSLQWVFLTAPTGEENSITIRFDGKSGEEISGADLIEETRLEYRAALGDLSLVIPKTGSSLLEVRRDSGEIVLGPFRNEISGIEDAPPNREIRILENGPLRGDISIADTYNLEKSAGTMTLLTRIRCWAGQSYLGFDQTFILDSKAAALNVSAYNLVIDGQFSKVEFDAGNETVTTDSLPMELSQQIASVKSSSGKNDFPYRLADARKVLAEGREFGGRLVLDAGAEKVGIAMADFWQNSPKEIRLEPTKLILRLFGDGITYYRGMGKTHRLAFSFGDSANDLTQVLRPPVWLADAKWYNDTGALFTRLPTRRAFPIYESKVEEVFRSLEEGYRSAGYTPGFGGLVHYGDKIYSKAQPYHALNLETEISLGLMKQLLRTHDPRYLQLARTTIGHFIDIDIDESSEAGGHIYIHSPHENRASHDTSSFHGHAWFNGTALYGLITGDPRALDVAPLVGARYSESPLEPRSHVDMWRNVSWSLLAQLTAWQLTGNNDFLASARKLVEMTRLHQDYNHNWHQGAKMKSLRMFHEMTGDPEVLQLYLGIADAFLQSRSRAHSAEEDEAPLLAARSLLILNELAEAYRLTGERRYADFAVEEFRRIVAFDQLNLQGDPSLLFATPSLIALMDELQLDPGEPLIGNPMSLTYSDDMDGPHLSLTLVREKTGTPFVVSLYQLNGRFRGNPVVVSLFDEAGSLVHSEELRFARHSNAEVRLPETTPEGIYTLRIQPVRSTYWTIVPVMIDTQGTADALRLERSRGTRSPVLALDPGIHSVTVRPQEGIGGIGIDAIAVTDWEIFASDEEFDLEGFQLLFPERDSGDVNWTRYKDSHARSGQVYVYEGPGARGKPANPEAGSLEFKADFSRPGRYRLFIHLSPYRNAQPLRVRIGNTEEFILTSQVFHTPPWSANPVSQWSVMVKGAVIR